MLFLCAAKGIDIEIAFTKKLGTGFFGGEGFILQRLKRQRQSLYSCHESSYVQKTLQAVKVLDVDTGCLVGMTPSINYDIQFIRRFKNVMFGGEGLFFATLTGPGMVYLQSLPFSRLADQIVAGSMRSREESKGLGGLGGGIIGNILSGDR